MKTFLAAKAANLGRKYQSGITGFHRAFTVTKEAWCTTITPVVKRITHGKLKINFRGSGEVEEELKGKKFCGH